jgi:hypothetical protein
MKSVLLLLAAGFCLVQPVVGGSLETKPNDPFFARFAPLAAPKPKAPGLQIGDRLAICGDSITEQRMYSRIMETYIRVALPELGISTRQFGWGGEQAPGSLARMTNDVLRFKPTVATTCYGMNDHHYRPYEAAIGNTYLSNMTAIVEGFKAAGTRVIVGSPTCMGLKNPPYPWILGTPEDRNLNLCALRNLDVKLAQDEHMGFADVFWPMYVAQFQARQAWGANYAMAGRDSVHPNWAGHLIMAYAFLKALDAPGDIGTFTVDLKSGKATASHGHEIVSYDNGTVTIKSMRYPFCATGATNEDSSLRSGMALVPFNQELNRLILIVKHTKAQHYKVAWGEASRDYAAAQLKHGVNLAADFPANPFSQAFAAVDDAVAKKQDYETRQIKELFHGKAGQSDMEKTVADSEAERARLVEAIDREFVPVNHTLTITAEESVTSGRAGGLK